MGSGEEWSVRDGKARGVVGLNRHMSDLTRIGQECGSQCGWYGGPDEQLRTDNILLLVTRPTLVRSLQGKCSSELQRLWFSTE